ncbi:MAG: asparagine synthase-related protein [Dehalococcoidia bacterium]
MSGIAGVYYLDGRPADEAVLRAMTGAVRHRRADHTGHWANGSVGLGHVQLCTTPESTHETQPVILDDGNYALVWDGRLDNREELVRELRSKSQVSTRSTDVDIVLAAYAAWGQGFLKRLIGDFAFALWDGREQQLICARDPVGVRLFHFYFDGTRFVFSTEIRQILQHPGVPRKLNELMLGMYLSGSPFYGDLTFYDGIKRLQGGNALLITRRGLKVEEYWNPDPADAIRYRDERQYLEHFNDLFSSAVQSRLRSATAVGIFLSGGLDSSSVTSVAGSLRQTAKVAPTQGLKGYHFTYSSATLDEGPYAEEVSDRYQIELKRVQVDDLWALKPTPGDSDLDEPFLVPLEAMNCRGLQVAKEDGISVMLSGEGGDEAFSAGNMLYLRDWLFHGRLRTIWQDYKNGTAAYRRAARHNLRRGVTAGIRRRLTGGVNGAIPAWLNRDFVRRTGLSERLDAQIAYKYRDTNYVQHRGCTPFFVGWDRRAASYGIEMRHPFWDSRIVEFMMRIPPTVRVQGGREKLMLKKAMANILPNSLLNRGAYGAFGPQVRRGWSIEEAPRLRQLTEQSCLEEIGVVQPNALRNAYAAYRGSNNGRSGLSSLYWTLTTENWLRSSNPFPEAHLKAEQSSAVPLLV